MTINRTEVSDPFAFLYPHQFVVLTTYRKDGMPVPTTVWFAHDQGRLYVITHTNSGKMKRLRANGRVTLAPSDRVGNLLGDQYVDGHAHEAISDERAYARALLEQKYGPMFEQMAGPETPESAYIVIEPV
jgi:PPOX class probable F420-dependent enzyme